MRARWIFTSSAEGDFASSVPSGELEQRCRRLVDLPWTLLDQVHGSTVVEVDAPGACAGSSADAAVTAVAGAALAIRTADCAGVVLVGSSAAAGEMAVGVAHAGWRGLADGVLQNTVERLLALGAEKVEWHLGPCISAAAYEFGVADLDRVVERYGPTLRARTAGGSPALDLRAGVAAALAEVGAVRAGSEPPCTATDPGYFSWRARGDHGRQVTVAWLEAEDH